MKIVEKDPRVPLRLKPEHKKTMARQIGEVIQDMIDKDVFVKKTAESKTTPEQLAAEKSVSLRSAAMEVLEKIHRQKMTGRLAQFHTTCRYDGCEKKPRIGKSNKGTNTSKNRRRTFVFCPGHAGVRNRISKRDYQRLKSNYMLRIVA